MGQHSHEHTHDGLTNPGGATVHGPVDHDHPHTIEANKHHHYTGEPAVGAPGPITPGQWLCRQGQDGHTPRIYVTRGDQVAPIADVLEPKYWDGDYSAEAVPAGTREANAKLMTFSPALLRFVQHVAAQEGGGVIPHRDAALALIEQLNEMEVRSDADRW